MWRECNWQISGKKDVRNGAFDRAILLPYFKYGAKKMNIFECSFPIIFSRYLGSLGKTTQNYSNNFFAESNKSLIPIPQTHGNEISIGNTTFANFSASNPVFPVLLPKPAKTPSSSKKHLHFPVNYFLHLPTKTRICLKHL